MKWISDLGLVAALALASGVAFAQDFSAGKTPAQLFGSDCSACHRTPGGLAANRDLRTLTAFLRQHYTTNPESAGALAAYVGGFAGTAGPRPGAAAATSGTGDDGRTAARPGENPARRRRTTELSGDGEKPRRELGAEPPRPAGVANPASRSAAEGGVGASAPPPPRPVGRGAQTSTSSGSGAAPLREPIDPLARLRAYATSGLGYEAVAAEAAKEARPSEGAPPAAGDGDPAVARAGADGPAVVAAPGSVPPPPSGEVAARNRAVAVRNPAVQARPPLPR
jgi:hypothetical protein